MPLKTLVKAGKITNLSDARYCAGMGVSMLGFSVIENQPHFIAPKLYQEIRGWVTGPQIVAELYGISDAGQIAEIISQYAPDFLELSLEEFKMLENVLPIPCIVKTDSIEDKLKDHPNIAYLLMDDSEMNEVEPFQKYIIHTNKKESLHQALSIPDVKGISINGSAEIRPGFKNYDSMADILEALDDE